MTHAPHDFALVIGINDYPLWGAKGNSLQGPVRDAQAFAAWLRDGNNGGLLYDNVRLVTSTATPLAPLKHHIDAELEWISSEIKKLSIRPRRFYFYFAGHGHIRIGQGNDVLMLCLPNWSFQRPAAALNLQSYINVSLACFHFDEAVYFLDCCRVDQAAPLGLTCELECTHPEFAGRHYAIAYATEHFKLGFEGDVGQGEIRGYFSSALLDILEQGPISLPDLKERLEELVPVRSGNKQFPRIPYDIPTAHARSMIFGPPGPLPSPPQPSPEPTFRLRVRLHTNLMRDLRPEEQLAPAPGVITVFDAERRRVAAGRGELDYKLPGGSYFVRIEHGDAATEEPFELAQDLELARDLPRRHSAAPLSNTVDSHEWLSQPAYIMSHRENVREGESAVLIFARHPQERGEVSLTGDLVFTEGYHHRDSRRVASREIIRDVKPGTHFLHFYGRNAEQVLTLPVPIASGWDTLIFFVAVDGRPVLERATVLMQEAGLGFNRYDALLDAYERTLVDLVSGGDIDDGLLEDLLWGKYRNPLFGLVGAHFLFRRLAKAPSDPLLREKAQVVIRNLRRLLGEDSPDVQVLQLLEDELPGRDKRDIRIWEPPLLRPALLAMFSASADRPKLLNMPSLNEMALNAIAESPWNCWHAGSRDHLSWWGSANQRVVNISVNMPRDKLDFAQRVLERNGFSVSVDSTTDGVFELKGNKPREGEGDDWAFTNILNLPSWLIDHFVEEIDRANRLGHSIDLVQHTKRSALPVSLVKAAVEAAKVQMEINAKETDVERLHGKSA
jgi:Caspase domain